jgi:hypothetical protein
VAIETVEVNSGTGIDVAVDDCGAEGNAQVMKLAVATDGSATLIPADSDGLLVNLGANNDVTVAGVATAAKQDSQTTLLAGGLPAALAAGGGLKVEGVAGGVAVPVSVAVIPSHAVTNAGVFAVQVDGNALTALQLIDDPVAVLGTATYTETTTKGMIVGGVRRDADTTLVDATNEIAPFQVDARGCVKVEAFSGETLPVSLASVPSHAVTNAGVFAVQVDGSALTALQLIDDPVQVLGTDTYTEATSKGMTIGAVRRDADTTLVNTTNEFGPLQMDANGRLKVEAFSGETLPVSLATLPALVAGSANIGDVDVLTVPTDPFGANADAASATGSISAKLRFIAATGIPITALPASTNTIEVVGDTAHDAGIAGNPVRVGARALTSDYTAVSTGDTADLIATILGKLVVKPFALPGSQWTFSCATGGITDTTGVTIKTAGAAGVRNYITDLQVINGHATVSTEVVIRDGASGTVIHRGWAQAAGGGYSIQFASPLRGSTATLLEVACVTTGSAVRVSANGYEAAE